jgi:hypothetical protein
LQASLSTILSEKVGFETYRRVDNSFICIGLPIATTFFQIALMTETGIEILERNRQTRYTRPSGNHQVECFAPLSLDQADVDILFPRTKFPADKLSDAIIETVLQSPNKK